MVLETTYFSETPIRDQGDDRGGSGSTGATSKAPPPEKIAPGGKPLSARCPMNSPSAPGHPRRRPSFPIRRSALDYALFAMSDGNRGYERYGTTMKATRPSDPSSGTDGEADPGPALLSN